MTEDKAGLASALGFRLEEVGAEQARGWFDAEERTLQAFGIVHGGMYALVAEFLAFEGTRAGLDAPQPDLRSAINTSFLRPAAAGARVFADAVARHRDEDLAVWDVSFADESGGRCAVSRVEVRLGRP